MKHRNTHSIRALLAAFLAVTACIHAAQDSVPPAQSESANLGPAAITQVGTTWILENKTLRAAVKFENGSVDLASLVNRRAGREYLTGSGPCVLFRHTVDGEVLAATDGKWARGGAHVADITAFGKHWGRSLTLDLVRPSSKITVSLVFEIYDGDAGLRYGSFLQNDDATRERVIASSDILTLDVPNEKHTLDYVPWQTKWSSTTAGLEKAKRNCLLRYDSGDGLAVLPENNWCTSLSPAKGDPKQPFLFMNVFAGGDTGIRVYSNPTAVQLTLFPLERFEYFWVNLQPFTGDALAGRAAVAEHFHKSFKYHDSLPQVDFQEFQVEYFQSDALARQHLLPALAEAGFDKWEVTWRWNGAGNYGEDSPLPRPGFTDNLPALADYAKTLGLKMGYYFTMTGCHDEKNYGWGGGRDLANPKEIAYKRAQVEDILIQRHQSTWQMIDLGELWKNDEPTTYSHPSDNVYRKVVNLRNYMSTVARAHPGFQMLTTCETENPGTGGTQGPDSAQPAAATVTHQCVSLMLIGENGQAGAYKRTDGASGFANIQANLRDAMNYIGLLPLEACVQVHGEDANDPWPAMFTPQACYASLLGGCSTYYSDVRRWAPEQRKFLRQFNDWRKNPRMGALLRAVAYPLATGEENQGPYAWSYTSARRGQALLLAVGFGSAPANLAPRLRTVEPSKTYLVEEITQTPDGDYAYAYRGEFTGARLKAEGLPIDLDAGVERCSAFWIQEQAGAGPQVLYADAAVLSYQEKSSAAGLTVEVQGRPKAAARLIAFKPGKSAVENRAIVLDAQGRATVTFNPMAITQTAQQGTSRPLTTTVGRRDTKTAGAWPGKYGTIAAWLAGHKIDPANDFSLRTSAPVYVWGRADATRRVLALPSGQTGSKVAACWTTADQFTMSVAAPPGRSYRLTVYVLDYDHNKRGMEITVKSRDGKVCDRQNATIEETGEGIYLSWEVSGPVTIKARKTEGFNAVVSGVFVDEATANQEGQQE